MRADDRQLRRNSKDARAKIPSFRREKHCQNLWSLLREEYRVRSMSEVPALIPSVVKIPGSEKYHRVRASPSGLSALGSFRLLLHLIWQSRLRATEPRRGLTKSRERQSITAYCWACFSRQEPQESLR